MCACVCVFVRTYVCVRVWCSVHVYVCMYVCMYVGLCMYVCMYVYVCMYYNVLCVGAKNLSARLRYQHGTNMTKGKYLLINIRSII